MSSNAADRGSGTKSRGGWMNQISLIYPSVALPHLPYFLRRKKQGRTFNTIFITKSQKYTLLQFNHKLALLPKIPYPTKKVPGLGAGNFQWRFYIFTT